MSADAAGSSFDDYPLARRLGRELCETNMQDQHRSSDVYFGRGQSILLNREWIKRKTMEKRRLQHSKSAAQYETQDGPNTPQINKARASTLSMTDTSVSTEWST